MMKKLAGIVLVMMLLTGAAACADRQGGQQWGRDQRSYHPGNA